MAAPSLPDDLVEEVLLHVRADDPASLVRAALACRRWCRLVADPAFWRRRLKRHGATPPMLGFLCQCDGSTWTVDNPPCTRFVPMSSCCPPRADHRGKLALDARHGRVLLQDWLCRDFLFVWDPITDRRVVVARPPRMASVGIGCSTEATVLCAATASGACDHLDCHRGHFIVVLVGQDMSPNGKMFTSTYSSESGAWSELTYANRPIDSMDCCGCSALVGNTVPQIRTYDRILKYDLCTQETCVVDLPRARANMKMPTYLIQLELTTLEDGRLGFVRREESNKLYLWSRDEDGDEVAVGWTLRRVIDLKKLFPLIDSRDAKNCLVSVVEGVCVAFMAMEKRGLFTIDMKTGLMSKVSEDFSTAYWAVPYTNFRTLALRAPPRNDEPVD